MEAMREAWTDERLDDFRGEVNRRFDRVEQDMKDLRAEMNTRFDRVASSIDALNLTIHRTLLQLGFGLIVTMILGFAGIVLA